MKTISKTIEVEFGDLVANVRMDDKGRPVLVENVTAGSAMRGNYRTILQEVPAEAVERIAAMMRKLRGGAGGIGCCPDHGYHLFSDPCPGCFPAADDD